MLGRRRPRKSLLSEAWSGTTPHCDDHGNELIQPSFCPDGKSEIATPSRAAIALRACAGFLYFLPGRSFYFSYFNAKFNWFRPDPLFPPWPPVGNAGDA
jgi:hypothetical protein